LRRHPFAVVVLLAARTAVCEPVPLRTWIHEGPRATFHFTGDELATSGAGNAPNWVHTPVEYENFHVTFDYWLAKWAEAQVIVRAPREGRPAQAGIAIELAHDFHKVVDNYITGAIAGVRPPRDPLPASFEAWHSVDLLLDGVHLRVTIDGHVEQDLELSSDPELPLRLKRGFIGFPDLGYAYKLRNLRLEDLGSPTKYVDLFDGASIANWQARGTGAWEVREGHITGADSDGILYAPPEFRDFELTALVRSHHRVNSGIFLRGRPSGSNRGFEIQIYSPVEAVYPTGSIYGQVRSRIEADYEEGWFLMQITLHGRRCRVRIDGHTVAETDQLEEKADVPGQIGLQIHSVDSSVDFRDLRVYPLSR
jgi:hypothetical protein